MNSQQIVVMEITDPVMPDPRPQESANVPAGGEVAAATESIEPARGITLKWPTIWCTEVCPRRESNPHLRFRKPSFYPLNYEDSLFPISYINSPQEISESSTKSSTSSALIQQCSRTYFSM